jgi:hypothetical protein
MHATNSKQLSNFDQLESNNGACLFWNLLALFVTWVCMPFNLSRVMDHCKQKRPFRSLGCLFAFPGCFYIGIVDNLFVSQALLAVHFQSIQGA